MTRSRAFQFSSVSALAAVLTAGCASQASPGPGPGAAPQTRQSAFSTISATGQVSQSAHGSSSGSGASHSSTGSASSASQTSSTGGSPSTAALPASAKGDHQRAVEVMDRVGTSHLPIHRTASLGASAKVYQVAAAKYRDVLTDLSATGYGDAESSANTYILILGQLKPVRPVPDIVDGTLAAMGAHGIVERTKLGRHAAASSLVMSCGDLASGYSVCVWMGGTNGDLFMGAFEAPAGTGVNETAALSESVFGYVAP
jgi:hypothetical protein